MEDFAWDSMVLACCFLVRSNFHQLYLRGNNISLPITTFLSFTEDSCRYQFQALVVMAHLCYHNKANLWRYKKVWYGYPSHFRTPEEMSQRKGVNTHQTRVSLATNWDKRDQLANRQSRLHQGKEEGHLRDPRSTVDGSDSKRGITLIAKVPKKVQIVV